MKLTKSTLKRLIKEEIENLLDEEDDNWIKGINKAADIAVGAAQDWQLKQTADNIRQKAEDALHALPPTPDEMAAGSMEATDKQRGKDFDAMLADLDEFDRRADQVEFEAWLKIEFQGPETARRHINKQRKIGRIDKVDWRKLRRKFHRAKKGDRPTDPRMLNALKAAAGKLGRDAGEINKAADVATSKGFLPGSSDYEKSMAITTRK